MASRLLSANYSLTVYNRSKERTLPFSKAGAFVADTPRQAASRADIIISMVADDVASRAVWLGADGVLAGASPGSVLIECSTLTVGWIKDLAAAAAECKCEFLDAPVTGTKPHAASGELVFLVGGWESALTSVRPVLSVLGHEIIHLGPNGSGALLKLINNFVCGVQAASLAEAVSLIEASALDLEKALSVLTSGAPGSGLVKRIAERVASADFTPNFLLRLMAKDIEYVLKEASELGIELQTAASALTVFQHAIDKGYGDKDVSAIVRSLREN
jgi:3-hydroxyisobutyrate dehydrogenase